VVWENEAGGLTFELGDGADRFFVKWTATGSGVDLDNEAARLSWAAPFTPVPALLDQGADDTGSWIVTSGLPGTSAVEENWRRDPATAVAAIGRGLRQLHENLPLGTCPFSWSAESRLEVVRARAKAGALSPKSWHPEHSTLTVDQALDILSDLPPVERLVVCHGDPCAPNTLISEDGSWSGHVDMGTLGIADRWADLAIATWSTNWNYGPGWEEQLLDAYGIAPDRTRTRYYRLLWDLGP
jgi:kanamycin kinase